MAAPRVGRPDCLKEGPGQTGRFAGILAHRDHHGPRHGRHIDDRDIAQGAVTKLILHRRARQQRYTVAGADHPLGDLQVVHLDVSPLLDIGDLERGDGQPVVIRGPIEQDQACLRQLGQAGLLGPSERVVGMHHQHQLIGQDLCADDGRMGDVAMDRQVDLLAQQRPQHLL